MNISSMSECRFKSQIGDSMLDIVLFLIMVWNAKAINMSNLKLRSENRRMY